MNEDGRPDAEEPHEPVYDALAVALNHAPEVRRAIRGWVDTWRATHPRDNEETVQVTLPAQAFEMMRAMDVLWQLVEDQRDRDERADPNDPQGPWAGIVPPLLTD